MSLDLWFREDVARILASTRGAMAAVQDANPALDPDRAEAYRQGFTDALRSVAAAFGVEDAPPAQDYQRWLIDVPVVVYDAR